MTIFENDGYEVRTGGVDNPDDTPLYVDDNAWAQWCEVINKMTHQIEFRSPVAIECIFFAQQQNAMMRDEPWKWYDSKQDPVVAPAMGKDLPN